MELHAYTKNVAEILSQKRQYLIPRFQREYSWTREEIEEFWDDITSNVKIKTVRKKSKITNEEYFIGCLVLVGEDKDFQHSIVDGQQRLTTITILIRALVDALKNSGQTAPSDALYENYIEGKDNDGKVYFKLDSQRQRLFFKNEIQYKDPAGTNNATTEEDQLLKYAYDFFSEKLKSENIKKRFGEHDYGEIIKFIRDQILDHLKFIHITVKSEDDAYTIFETLNARGLNLSSLDLIKNWIFKNLKTTHPTDNAQENWKKINNTLASRQYSIDIDTFFRHYWNSKFGYSSEDRIYKNFKALVANGDIHDAKAFLNELVHESSMYNKICNPLEIDWPGQSNKNAYSSLTALNTFKIVQARPFILSMLANQKNINPNHIIHTLKSLEHFHFAYTATCSLRASGLDGKYSKAARDIRLSQSKNDSKTILNELLSALQQKMPSPTIFTERFKLLNFRNGFEKDKKVIQYFMSKYECYAQNTTELKLHEFTIEHIMDQSLATSDYIGQLGNLIPLDGKINNAISSKKKLSEKVVAYQSSSLKSVHELLQFISNSPVQDWNEAQIKNRTAHLANAAYNNIFKVEIIT